MSDQTKNDIVVPVGWMEDVVAPTHTVRHHLFEIKDDLGPTIEAEL